MISRLHRLIYDENLQQQADKKVFTVYGTGKPLRQFIYSLDLAKLMVWTLRSYDSVDPIILSGELLNFCLCSVQINKVNWFSVDESAEVSIGNVAQSIAKAFQFKGTIRFETDKADGQFKKTASNAKLRALLPDFEFTDFETAISETVKWYSENTDLVRK